MAESFDAFEFVEYLRGKWRVPLIACLLGGLLALTISLLQPKRYTATATIMIDPPASGDVRMSTAISPMYLESLKTYEQIAASDSLFLRAATKYHLQDGGRRESIESLKKRVLKVSKLRDTKILEISATLNEPSLCQHFVQYLAEQSILLSRDENAALDSDSIDGAQHQLSEAELSLEGARSRWKQSGVAGEALDAIQVENDANIELLAKLQQSYAETKTDLADYLERERLTSSRSDRYSSGSVDFDHQQTGTEQARIAELRQQIQNLQEQIEKASAVISSRGVLRDQLSTELKAAQSARDGAAGRVGELRAGSGMRGERLRMIDPGIVPQRPSSPNITLNVLVALLTALTASLLYLSLAFGYRRRSPARTRVSPSRAG